MGGVMPSQQRKPLDTTTSSKTKSGALVNAYRLRISELCYSWWTVTNREYHRCLCQIYRRGVGYMQCDMRSVILTIAMLSLVAGAGGN